MFAQICIILHIFTILNNFADLAQFRTWRYCRRSYHHSHHCGIYLLIFQIILDLQSDQYLKNWQIDKYFSLHARHELARVAKYVTLRPSVSAPSVRHLFLKSIFNIFHLPKNGYKKMNQKMILTRYVLIPRGLSSHLLQISLTSKSQNFSDLQKR